MSVTAVGWEARKTFDPRLAGEQTRADRQTLRAELIEGLILNGCSDFGIQGVLGSDPIGWAIDALNFLPKKLHETWRSPAQAAEEQEAGRVALHELADAVPGVGYRDVAHRYVDRLNGRRLDRLIAHATAARNGATIREAAPGLEQSVNIAAGLSMIAAGVIGPGTVQRLAEGDQLGQDLHPSGPSGPEWKLPVKVAAALGFFSQVLTACREWLSGQATQPPTVEVTQEVISKALAVEGMHVTMIVPFPGEEFGPVGDEITLGEGLDVKSGEVVMTACYEDVCHAYDIDSGESKIEADVVTLAMPERGTDARPDDELRIMWKGGAEVRQPEKVVVVDNGRVVEDELGELPPQQENRWRDFLQQAGVVPGVAEAAAVATATAFAQTGPDATREPTVAYPQYPTYDEFKALLSSGGALPEGFYESQDVQGAIAFRRSMWKLGNPNVNLDDQSRNDYIALEVISYGSGGSFRWDVVGKDKQGRLAGWLQIADPSIQTGWRYAEGPSWDSHFNPQTDVFRFGLPELLNPDNHFEIVFVVRPGEEGRILVEVDKDGNPVRHLDAVAQTMKTPDGLPATPAPELPKIEHLDNLYGLGPAEIRTLYESENRSAELLQDLSVFPEILIEKGQLYNVDGFQFGFVSLGSLLLVRYRIDQIVVHPGQTDEYRTQRAVMTFAGKNESGVGVLITITTNTTITFLYGNYPIESERFPKDFKPGDKIKVELSYTVDSNMNNRAVELLKEYRGLSEIQARVRAGGWGDIAITPSAIKKRINSGGADIEFLTHENSIRLTPSRHIPIDQPTTPEQETP